ncbi:gag/pol protein [Cucumis melo var. makuwa]|uniref:Gag/pol protein n=1 Tax=Cucumis melo var. makuwa TaxID=1194695 RepID=A0A5A7UB22_CUCMM|nr:gag/pol protein [Cucumis melo var. makuwa]
MLLLQEENLKEDRPLNPKLDPQNVREIEKKGKGKTLSRTRETSSWKRLSEGEITLKVGTGEMMDVKTVFSNGNLEESIYMVQPEMFIQKGQEQKNVDEPCVYKRIIKSTVTFLVLYVDDILLFRNDVGHLTDIKEWLAMQFQMKDLGNAQYTLEQCPKTPQEVEDVSNIPYPSAVGSLMYAMLCTRPDICYSVGIGSKDLILTGYTDSNFQTDKDARKSTLGSVFTLNGGAIVWRNIKQSCIADSTMEAEYVAICETTKEVVWLQKFLTDLEVLPNMHLPITLYCDNRGAVANS